MRFPVMLLCVAWCLPLRAAQPLVIDLWPGAPPGPPAELPAEADQTKETDPLIAGRRIIKLGNVTTPQIAVYRPPAEIDTGAAVVICPGGGYHILAYDLEGTEVAEWLNGLGVTGIVLKYRVPFRDPANRGLAGLQDAQRALSVARHRAADWAIDPRRIGILGFSAGGDIAGRTVFRAAERQYPAVDAADSASCRPDFLIMVYGAGFVDKDAGQLKPDLALSTAPPPAFFVHAWDDFVDVRNPLALAAEWKRAGGSAELHVFPTGGHGYGLRQVEHQPVTEWATLCTRWLRAGGLLEKKPAQ
jgi:acetyl esterase/lipase